MSIPAVIAIPLRAVGIVVICLGIGIALIGFCACELYNMAADR